MRQLGGLDNLIIQGEMPNIPLPMYRPLWWRSWTVWKEYREAVRPCF
jgi:hypothetical protein